MTNSQSNYRRHDVPSDYIQKWQKTIDVLARVLEVPAGLIMRVLPDEIEVLVRSATDDNPYDAGERADLGSGLYCETVMATRATLHVENALEDPDWQDNPDTKIDMNSYLGVPLIWPDGSVFGTMCVLDQAAVPSGEAYVQLLEQFRQMIELDFQLLDRNAELSEAKLAAENANHSKSEFLSHMSHELRTPLNGILGYAQILQRDPSVTSDQRESLNAIESCGSHLLELINDVLDLSRIEAGRIEVENSPCDLSKLIKSVMNVVEQRAMSKGVTCTTEVSPEVPQGVCIDEAKVRQILINLLGNSVKFTAKGNVVLAVSEQPKGQLCFEVRDTGVGMTPEELEDIFDPFKQLEAGKAAGGTGLGLAISQRLIDAMQGTIAVTSEKNIGSTFTVRLPLVEADTEDMSILDSQGAIDYGMMVLAPGETCTVLVVDDRETNRDILDRMLTAAGITSLIADDGDTALEMMRAHPEIDLVLMDVRMPRLNGIEAVGQIRADESLRDTKVIAVTASVFPEFRTKAIESGFDDFLGKPFRTEEMLQKIRTHLKIRFNEVNLTTESNDESVPTTKLTAALSLEIAKRIHDAVKLGNVTALNALVAELERNHNAASLGRRISELTRAFDFEGLESVAIELSEDSET